MTANGTNSYLNELKGIAMSIDSLLGSDLGRALIDRTRTALDELAQSIAQDLSKHGIVENASEGQSLFLQLLDRVSEDSEQDASEGTCTASGSPAATRTAPSIELTEGLQTSDMANGMLHVSRDRNATLPWDGNGLNTALKSYWDAALVPDASGMLRDQVAPGLEGWNEVVQNGDNGKYHGYRGYLEKNYPGGYDAWSQAFDDYRRVALNGENLEINIANTSGMDTVA